MDLKSFIDHTILKPEATREQVIKICKEAREYKFASVCVNPYYVELVNQQLKDTDVEICCVVGFPLGATMKEVKEFETKKCLEFGANEVDMVINIGALKDKEYEIVKDEIKSLANLCHEKDAILKVIIETCLLNDDEKKKACELSVEAGADFVKTSTGFSSGGATVEDVRLMKKTVGYDAKVKASGGIRDYTKAVEMVENGADRIGASASIYIVEGAE